MANIIYNNITIESEEAMDKICNIFDEIKGDTTSIVKAFYTEEDLRRPYNNGETEYPITDQGVLISWLYDNVGTKWITGGVDDCIKSETANYLPDGFLIKLYQICNEEFEDVRITCKWYDECETNIGTAFIKDGIYAEDEETLEDEDISDPAYEPTGEEDIDDVDLEEFADEIDSWIIDELKAIGCDTAKSVLDLGLEDLVKRTDLEEVTIEEVLRILRAEFDN